MTEYQRNRQAEAPRGEVKVHAHLHGLDINAAVELDEAGAFGGLPCEHCQAAIEWSLDTDEWQHHATKNVRCRNRRTVATPPDWYTGQAVEVDDEEAVDETAETLDLTDEAVVYDEATRLAEPHPVEDPAPAKPPRVDGNPYDTEFARGVMAGLQHKPTYQGTVPADEVERRRLRNRDANRARRANRRARVKRTRARYGNGPAA
ncbi:hypothetical protein [Mycobacterium phage Weirdo19]|uniref:Uncharacterized protein n=1 Tax=Mycobacterium phage Weirdo19 TaxID=2601610 RepID=A0A6M2YSZ6_9CAUD|nr:hypothetical protein KDJ11_gp54 [Mycobacterium phage Weirdo19]QEA10822.1 hypothetical protein [Mycobacterium phage Weirdo19]